MVVGVDGDMGRVGKGEVVDGIAPSLSREARSLLVWTTIALYVGYKNLFLASHTIACTARGVHCQPTYAFVMIQRPRVQCTCREQRSDRGCRTACQRHGIHPPRS